MKGFVIAAVLTAALAGGAAPAFAESAVTRVQGNAVIAGPQGARPAKVGSPIADGETIRTEAGATADVAMGGLAGFRLLEGTSCTVGPSETGNMKVALTRGNVVLNLKKLPVHSSFSLESPLAVATVRGTQFWGRVPGAAESEQTTFAVREGAVELQMKATGKSFTLNAGEALDVPQADSPVPPQARPALAEELGAMAQADEIATSA